MDELLTENLYFKLSESIVELVEGICKVAALKVLSSALLRLSERVPPERQFYQRKCRVDKMVDGFSWERCS